MLNYETARFREVSYNTYFKKFMYINRMGVVFHIDGSKIAVIPGVNAHEDVTQTILHDEQIEELYNRPCQEEMIHLTSEDQIKPFLGQAIVYHNQGTGTRYFGLLATSPIPQQSGIKRYAIHLANFDEVGDRFKSISFSKNGRTNAKVRLMTKAELRLVKSFAMGAVPMEVKDEK